MNKSNNKPEEGMTPEEKLRMENELNKLKLQAEFGAKFQGASDLPPEIENEFLKNVMAFEEQFQNRITIRVFDFIGKPEFKNADDLNDEEVTAETDRLYEIMEQNQVTLDVDADYEDRIIYKFITEELFEHEMEDMRVPGMVTHFCYEEFHPNHYKDLKRYAEDFLGYLMKRDLGALEFEAPTDLISVTGEVLSKEQCIQRIADFINAYTAFENQEFEIINIEFSLEGEVASVIFKCAYDAKLDDGTIQHFKGQGEIGSEFKYGYWYINRINIPGFIV